MTVNLDYEINKTTPMTLNWEQSLPNLPDIEQLPHIGLAGAFSGLLNHNDGQTLVLAGGTNFPKLSLLDAIKLGKTPDKRYHNDILLYQTLKDADFSNGRWALASSSLPFNMAHGASVNVDDGILIFGGEYQDENGKVYPSDRLYKLTLVDNEIKIEELAPMPVSFCYGSASKHKNRVYLCGGLQNGKPSNQVWQYNIKTSMWTCLPEYPGAPRAELISTIGYDQHGQNYLYLFSGYISDGNTVKADTTGVKLKLTENISTGQWQHTQPIITKGQRAGISLLGATALQIDQQHSLCFGGYNQTVFNNFVQQLQHSQNAEQTQQIKIEFFSQPSELFNWNKHALLFNSENETWLSLGETPFPANCGASIERFGSNIILLSGEIKPGVRTPSVNLGKLTIAGFDID